MSYGVCYLVPYTAVDKLLLPSPEDGKENANDRESVRQSLVEHAPARRVQEPADALFKAGSQVTRPVSGSVGCFARHHPRLGRGGAVAT